MVLLPSIQAVFPVSACVSCSPVLYTTYSMESNGKYCFGECMITVSTLLVLRPL